MCVCVCYCFTIPVYTFSLRKRIYTNDFIFSLLGVQLTAGHWNAE